jgi:hypothetical protein
VPPDIAFIATVNERFPRWVTGTYAKSQSWLVVVADVM